MNKFAWSLFVIVTIACMQTVYADDDTRPRCEGPKHCADDSYCPGRKVCLYGYCRRCDCKETEQCRLGPYGVYCDCDGYESHGRLCECKGDCDCDDIYGLRKECHEFSDEYIKLPKTEFLRPNGAADHIVATTDVGHCKDLMKQYEYQFMSFGHNKCVFFRGPLINTNLGQLVPVDHYDTYICLCKRCDEE